jgi:hypothetical protein
VSVRVEIALCLTLIGVLGLPGVVLAQAPVAQAPSVAATPAAVSAATASPSTTKPPETPGKRSNRKSKTKPEPAPEPAPVIPQPPPPPPTPEQLPAMPPTVNYRDGQLTIQAPNSTLSDILHAVRVKTGAAIEIPPDANERVVGQLGPGPARDVLASLLNGSHFNYVMLGTAANPNAVAQIILTSRAGSPIPGGAAGYQPPGLTPVPYQAGVQPAIPQAEQRQGFQPQLQPGMPSAPPGGQAQQSQEEQTSDDNATENAVEEQDTSQDNMPVADQTASDQEGQSQQGPPQVKTPEQLLQELQRQQQIMQQQQQQQQQQQSQPPQQNPQNSGPQPPQVAFPPEQPAPPPQ